MKKILPVLVLLLLGAATPAFCEPSRKDTVTRVESCEAVLQEIMSDPATAIPRPVWQAARAVIITNQFKAGYIFGIKGGYGLIMVKKTGGQWSVPVLLAANEASFGLQIGMKSVETVYIITDATIKAGMVSRDDDANFVLYDTNYTLPELLYSDWVTPPAEVQPLMSYVERLAQ
jgi:lipid-binding SYLF domain-containing protein